MNWRSSQIFTAGFCLLGLLAFCPAQAATTICWPDAAPYNTGSVYGPTLLDSEIVAWRTPASGYYQNYYHEVGYARFDVSAVPADEYIVSVTLNFYANDSSEHARYSLTPLEFDPLVTSDHWIRWDITSDLPSYRYATVDDDGPPGWREIDLGRNGILDLRSSLDAHWFGVGFYNHESGIRVDGWAEASQPYLEVEHRPGPATIHVDDDGPFDPGPGDPTVSDPDEDGTAAHPFDSIQEAIGAASWDMLDETDQVLVADGIYTGWGNRDITFDGKWVHVISAHGPENCIIDCQGSSAEPHRGFMFSYEGASTVVEGFTIREGYASYGGAITTSNYDCTPVIRGNVISGNTAISYGGGVYCPRGTLIGNRIINNSAGQDGGGVHANGIVTGNIISGNSAGERGGGIYTSSAIQPITGNAIVDNDAGRGGGIFSYHALEMSGCTVTGNSAATDGGGIYIRNSSTLSDCISRQNSSTTGKDLYFSSGTNTVSYCNIGNYEGAVYEGPPATVNWGPGVTNADPAFTSGAGGGHYLEQLASGHLADSVCVDAGSDPADTILIPVAWDMTSGETTWTLISEKTTAINFNEDSGMVDVGFHYPALSTVASRLTMAPAAGVSPFSTQIVAALDNQYTGQRRRVAARIDVSIASGGFFPSWRAGWTNIDAGSRYITSWIQNIPAYPTLIGENRFTLRAWDVTTAPYNQPPYPASGDSDSDTVTLTGLAP